MEKSRHPTQTTGDFTHWYQRVQNNCGLVSQLCPDYKVRNSNLDFKGHFCYVTQNNFLMKLTDEVSPSQSTFIFATKLNTNFMWGFWLFQITHQVGSAQGSPDVFSSISHWHCLGCKTSPLHQGSLHGRNTGLPSPSTHSAKGPESRTPHAQLSLAAPYRGNTFPFQVTGEAKTWEAQARLTDKHTKLTQSQTLKWHLRRVTHRSSEH